MEEVLTTAADSILGYENHCNPDWFRDSSETLEPVFVRRNQLYSKWLSSKQDCDKVQFLQARSRARKAARAAKNSWFQRKAEEAPSVRFGGKKVWQCIRDMQRAHRGLVPTRSTVVRNNDGTLCATPEAQHERWRQHFSSILNICSHFSRCGCADMVFTIRQLIEKSNEHKAKIFFVFIDQRKGYDSVPREGLWMALSKLGVPDSLIEILPS